ncbi:MAG: hypothetical protein AB1714_21305 [Acidobacteriota bacterium]
MSDPPVAICNSGPLIALGKLNRLDLLEPVFGEVEITQEVYREVVEEGQALGAPDALSVRMFWESRGWPIIQVPESVLSKYTQHPILGPGEREVIALALAIKSPLVLLDDEVARSEARRLRLDLCGTLGVPVRAFRGRLLSFEQVAFLLQEIAARPDIWISARLCEDVLNELRRP